MKKLFLFICTLVCIQASLLSQSCLPDGMTFSTQAEIDSFTELYPNCTEIEGDVFISGIDIKDLSGLSVLTYCHKKLHIEYNDSLNSLDGLNNLYQVGSNLIIEFNRSLTDLSGLSALTHIGGSFDIRRNMELKNLSGINSLETIEDAVTIYKNESLENLQGMESLSSIGKYLMVYFNPALNSFEGLYGLKRVGGLMIYVNESLKNLDGLEGLENVGEDFLIYYNDSLSQMTSLESLKSIDGSLTIHNNPLLVSLKGIDNINAASITQFLLFNNTSLSECEVKSVCDFVNMHSGNDADLNNAEGCNTINEIKEACESLSVTDLSGTEMIQIFPNPVDGQFIEVRANRKIDYMEIYDQYGNRVLHQISPVEKINISSITSGLNLIKIQTSDQVYFRKLIVH